MPLRRAAREWKRHKRCVVDKVFRDNEARYKITASARANRICSSASIGQTPPEQLGDPERSHFDELHRQKQANRIYWRFLRTPMHFHRQLKR
jgi:hypothetical protein